MDAHEAQDAHSVREAFAELAEFGAKGQSLLTPEEYAPTVLDILVGFAKEATTAEENARIVNALRALG